MCHNGLLEVVMKDKYTSTAKYTNLVHFFRLTWEDFQRIRPTKCGDIHSRNKIVSGGMT
jgi:hypothetical protein